MCASTFILIFQLKQYGAQKLAISIKNNNSNKNKMAEIYFELLWHIS